MIDQIQTGTSTIQCETRKQTKSLYDNYISTVAFDSLSYQADSKQFEQEDTDRGSG